MRYTVNVASELDYFASFDVTDPQERSLFHAAQANDKAVIEHFRDIVSKRYGQTGWASFDLVVDGQLLKSVRRIPYPKG